MHVQHAFRAGPLVQVVDVLGDDQQLAAPFAVEPRQGLVRRVRLGGEDVRPPLVVEPLDQAGIAPEALRGGDFLDRVVLPQSVLGAEGPEAGFGGDPRAGEDDDVACLSHCQPSTVMLNLFQHPSCPTDGTLGGEMDPETSSG